MIYYTAEPSQYLVVTGVGVDDLKITKKALVWPFQKVMKMEVTPVNYTLSLLAMTAEKLEFLLPAVFTIGPADNKESLTKYAKLIACSKNASKKKQDSEEVDDIVRGIIEGETRVIAAGMTMEEIFKERKFFKDEVIKNVQAELDQFGLFIYNANVKELSDGQGSEYFVYLRMKSHEGAVNQAKVDVAHAKYLGDIGEKKREGNTRVENCKVEADTIIFETQRQNEISKAQATLKVAEAEYNQQIEIAKIKQVKAGLLRDAELQKNVEIKLALVNQEKLRATVLSKVQVQAESKKESADADLYREQKDADAKLYEQMKLADGMKEILHSQSAGIAKLTKAFGNDEEAALQYIMLQRGTYKELSSINSKAIKEMQPQIQIWDTGKNAGQDTMKPIRDVFASVPPLMGATDQKNFVMSQ